MGLGSTTEVDALLSCGEGESLSYRQMTPLLHPNSSTLHSPSHDTDTTPLSQRPRTYHHHRHSNILSGSGSYLAS